jgi:hypothetical protein
MRSCNAILGTAIVLAVLGGLGGLALAHGRPMVMLVHAALGVWGGAIVGGLLGALACVMFPARHEPPQKLRAV